MNRQVGRKTGVFQHAATMTRAGGRYMSLDKSNTPDVQQPGAIRHISKSSDIKPLQSHEKLLLTNAHQQKKKKKGEKEKNELQKNSLNA